MFLRRIFFLYILFINVIVADTNSSRLKIGFIQTNFSTFYKEGNLRESNIQNIILSGFPLIYSYDSQYFLINVQQIYLMNLYHKIDREILYHPSQNKEKNERFFIYHTHNTFLGIKYHHIFLLSGFINPYDSLNEEFQKNYYQPTFASVDLRLDFKNHIITISPIFLYDKEQIFTKEYENYQILLNHFYLKHESQNYKNSQSQKIHYFFHYDFFSFLMGYYYIEQYNPYSNIKNYLSLNFYEYAIIFNFSYLYLKFQINQSSGNFKISNKSYNIMGYKYNFQMNFDYNFFKISLDLNRTTPSKWNSLRKDWYYYGYTSIFDEFLFTPQFSSTYVMTPNYEICHDNDICDGIYSFDSENHFKTPSNTAYLKLKFLMNHFTWIFATGYLEKSMLKNPNFGSHIVYDPWNNNSKIENIKHEFLEPYLQLIIKDNQFYFIFGYSLFYKKIQSNAYQPISRNFNITFLYYF